MDAHELTAGLIKEIGVPVSAHVVDVSKLDQVQKFADEVIEHHGRVTHLINNAGVGLIGTFDQLSNEDFLKKAPEKVLEGMRAKLADYHAQMEKSRKALASLAGA